MTTNIFYDDKTIQSQKTEGFRVADFATLSDERGRVRKFFYCLIWIKESCVRKFKELARSKILGISQVRVGSQATCESALRTTSPGLPRGYLNVTWMGSGHF